MLTSRFGSWCSAQAILLPILVRMQREVPALVFSVAPRAGCSGELVEDTCRAPPAGWVVDREAAAVGAELRGGREQERIAGRRGSTWRACTMRAASVSVLGWRCVTWALRSVVGEGHALGSDPAIPSQCRIYFRYEITPMSSVS